LPYTCIAALYSIAVSRFQVVYATDGVTSVIFPVIKLLTKAKFYCTIHGLEVTYQNRLINFLIIKGIQSCDKVVAISKNTKQLLIDKGIQADKIVLIYTGIKPKILNPETSQSLIESIKQSNDLDIRSTKYILNVGRMVKRKGVLLFLLKGLPLLDKSIKLVICGSGPDYDKIYRLSQTNALRNQVIVIQEPSDEVISLLRQNATLFISPNIFVPGDVEGFGMSQLESMYMGTPVVAFAVDAIPESVRRGGYLVKEGDYVDFIAQIHRFFELTEHEQQLMRQDASEYVRTEYSWVRAAKEYSQVLQGEH
jgi:glycosyltransferase involved in cell wall biosynthesis